MDDVTAITVSTCNFFQFRTDLTQSRRKEGWECALRAQTGALMQGSARPRRRGRLVSILWLSSTSPLPSGSIPEHRQTFHQNDDQERGRLDAPNTPEVATMAEAEAERHEDKCALLSLDLGTIDGVNRVDTFESNSTLISHQHK